MVIHFKDSSMYLSLPNSLTIHSPNFLYLGPKHFHHPQRKLSTCHASLPILVSAHSPETTDLLSVSTDLPFRSMSYKRNYEIGFFNLL